MGYLSKEGSWVSLTFSLSLLPAKKRKAIQTSGPQVCSAQKFSLTPPCSCHIPAAYCPQCHSGSREPRTFYLLCRISGGSYAKVEPAWTKRSESGDHGLALSFLHPITFSSRAESTGSKWPHARIGQGNLGTLPQVCREKEGAILHAQWEHAWSCKLQLASLLCCFFPSFKKPKCAPPIQLGFGYTIKNSHLIVSSINGAGQQFLPGWISHPIRDLLFKSRQVLKGNKLLPSHRNSLKFKS